MDEVLGEKLIFAVAQVPFEHSGESGVYNQFCSLVPLFEPNGQRANPLDFPDNGDVWWMVRSNARGLAEPGRLITAIVERSIKQEPGFAQYQVSVDSVEAVRGKYYIEILDAPPTAISRPRDLVRENFSIVVDHPPLDTVYLKWRGTLLGPLRTRSSSSIPGQWAVWLEPANTDLTVNNLSSNLLMVINDNQQLKGSAAVSMVDSAVHHSEHVERCHYHLIDTDAFNEQIPSDAERVSMKTDAQIISQLAKKLFSRAKRQQLRATLLELDNLADQSADPMDLDETRFLTALRANLDSESQSVAELAQAIVQAGLIEEDIQRAVEIRSDKYITDNAARLQLEVNKRIDATRRELETLQKEAAKVASQLQQQRKTEQKKLRKELEQERAEFDLKRKRDAEEVQGQLAELQRQETVLSNNLKKVASQLASNSDDVVNQFLTIAPLLGRFGLLPGRQPASPLSEPARPTALPRPEEPDDRPLDDAEARFEIPDFTAAASDHDLTEEDFFQRFKTHAENRGFRYRDVDLLSFHVSTKCGDLTILGGLPGTGKSSLPRIYAEAVRGEQPSDPERFLHVAVSPSWLDMRDLLGHVNALNRTFQPAESSLFQHLVHAQEEFQQVAEQSRLYFVCLDEMNLSHVEHYFSGLLQVLEQADGHRRLRCFPNNVVSPTSQFANWSSIMLPSSIRFVGTVNFDETTKQLSQRLLDRVNLIRLPSDQLPLELDDSAVAKPQGPPVLLRHHRSWIRRTVTYSDELAAIVDGLRDSLQVLNCPMNPRRFSAIRTFLASWPESIMPAEKAVDLQLAQRVLPQVRGLFQPGACAALDTIQKQLESHAMAFSESLSLLEDIRRSELSEFSYETEPET